MPKLKRQTFSAFGSAPSDDIATAGIRHPFQKTMRSGAFEFARLKCSFHNFLFFS